MIKSFYFLSSYIIYRLQDYNLLHVDVFRALYYCKTCHGYTDDIKVIKKCRCKMSK